MPITTTVRLVNANNAADRAFCVAAAGYAGLHWDENTVRAYANDPRFHLAILLGSWPERGINNNVRLAMLQTRRSEGAGGRSRGWCLAIDPTRIPDSLDNRRGRLKVADFLIHAMVDQAIIRGTAKSDVSAPIGSVVVRYLDTLPYDSRIEGETHIDYVLDIQNLKAAFTSPERRALYGGD